MQKHKSCALALAALGIAVLIACGGGPTGPDDPRPSPSPTPSPAPTPPGATLIMELPISFAPDPPGGGIGFDFTVPGPGDIEVQYTQAIIVAQTSSTHVYLSLHRASESGQMVCETLSPICLGIANDDAVVPQGATMRSLSAQHVAPSGGKFFLTHPEHRS